LLLGSEVHALHPDRDDDRLPNASPASFIALAAM
jgi:hypothetical protein